MRPANKVTAMVLNKEHGKKGGERRMTQELFR